MSARTDFVQDVGWFVIICRDACSSTHTEIVISRVPLIVADMILIYITWTRLSSRDALRVDLRRSKRPSLQDILFRDGMFLFSNVIESLVADES